MAATARKARTPIVIWLSTLLSLACTDARQVPADISVLTPLDPVRLEETDAAFVGEPTGFAVLEDGTFAISDRRNAILHHFATTGARLGGTGRRGEGPNEWVMGPTLAVAGRGHTVFVGDGPSIRAVDVLAKRFQWSRLRSARAIATSSYGDALVLVELDPATGASIHLVTGPDDSSRSGGPLPSLAASNPIVAGYFSHPAAAFLSSDTLALVVQSSEYLHFGAFPNGPFDSLKLTPQLRRGALAAELARINPSNPTAAQQLMYRPSYPQIVRPISDGRYVAVVFADLTMVSGRMTGQLHLEILDWRARRGCRELAIDVPADPLPYVDLRRDTLFVLTQRAEEAATSISEIRRYSVNAEACQWFVSDAP